MNAVSPAFEKPHFRKLVDELPVIFGNFGNRIAFELESGEELVEVLPCRPGVVSDERGRDFLAGEAEQRELAAGMWLAQSETL